MSRIKIYRYKILDAAKGAEVLSKRMATRDHIAMISGTPIESTELEVDSADAPNGMTEIRFGQ
jgi:hypothetical protein